MFEIRLYGFVMVINNSESILTWLKHKINCPYSQKVNIIYHNYFKTIKNYKIINIQQI